MTEEEKEKFRPAVEELKTAPKLMSEAVERKYNFDAHFATVVGVLFGVLAAFNNIGDCKVVQLGIYKYIAKSGVEKTVPIIGIADK